MNAKDDRPTKVLHSWRWLLPIAALPVIGYFVLRSAGGEQCIQLLTGVRPLSEGEMLLGALYLASYVALTLFTPVFVIAALLLALRDALTIRRNRSNGLCRDS